MKGGSENLVSDLMALVSRAPEQGRVFSLQAVAARIRSIGDYRWVGLYDVDHKAGVVRIAAWSGPGPPEFPSFPVTQGLTGAVVREKRFINVGDVSSDSRYLTAFASTRSEIIVPVFDNHGAVVGTLDIESEQQNAFTNAIEHTLQACSDIVRPLWESPSGPSEN